MRGENSIYSHQLMMTVLDLEELIRRSVHRETKHEKKKKSVRITSFVPYDVHRLNITTSDRNTTSGNIMKHL